MIGVALKGLLGRKLRAILTAFAIVLGVAMISGAFVLTDTLGKSFDGIYQDSYKSTDAVITLEGRRSRPSDGEHGGPGLLGRRARPRSQSLPGVRLAQGTIEDEARLVDTNGKPIGNDGRRHRGRRRPADRSEPQSDQARQRALARRATVRSRSTGRPPTSTSFAIGQTVGAFGDGPLAQYRISGIVRFGVGRTRSAARRSRCSTSRRRRRCSTSAASSTLIRVGAKNGVTDAELVSADPPAALRDDAGEDGRRRRPRRTARRRRKGMSVFKYFLLGFGGIALFVGGFVIANTLAITVAQRMRELATLRTLGASRRQVLGSVVARVAGHRPARLDRRAVPRARDRRRAHGDPRGDRRRAARRQPRLRRRGRSSSASASAR